MGMIEWREIDELSIEAKQLADLAMTVEDAMSYGPLSPETYLGALSLLQDLLHAHAKKLGAVVKNELEIHKRAESGVIENRKP